MILGRLDEIAAAVEGRIDAGQADVRVTGLTTDTRRIRTGELFVALDGERHRGSDFLEEAFRAGAGAALTARPRPVSGPLVEVDDAHRALLDLGGAMRDRLSCAVVGITGSNGKTSTKDALEAVLSQRFSTVAAEGSYNNRVGMPLTVARADVDTEVLVLEIGTSLPGEIERLTRVARPDHVILTSIGPSHLEGLGSIEGVLEEKLDIIRFMRPGGLVALNGDDPMLARTEVAEAVASVDARPVRYGLGRNVDLRPHDASWSEGGLSFRLSPTGPVIRAALIGRHNLLNLLGVVAIARELGMSEAEIAAGAASIRSSRWRMEEREQDGRLWLLDCYNANPASMSAAIEVLASREHAGRRVAVLGDMLELGVESRSRHEDLGHTLVKRAFDLVLLVGSETEVAAQICRGAGMPVLHVPDAEAARVELESHLRGGDLVLVKGSRGLRLETVIGEGG